MTTTDIKAGQPVLSIRSLKIGDRVTVNPGSGNPVAVTVWRQYEDPSIGLADACTVLARIRPGGYGITLRQSNMQRHDVRWA